MPCFLYSTKHKIARRFQSLPSICRHFSLSTHDPKCGAVRVGASNHRRNRPCQMCVRSTTCASHRQQQRAVVDLRSDTVTSPTRAMLQCALEASTGDDVMGEDATVIAIERYAADMFEKEEGLYLPSLTMANLCATMAHCHGRASEIIIGSNSHICLYEAGNSSGLAGVHTRQIPENTTNAQMDLDAIRYAFRSDDDDHYPRTEAIYLENSHNVLGGVALSQSYVDDIGRMARDELVHSTDGQRVKVHMDGARVFNSMISNDINPADMCRNVDSLSICLSKGLGAPLGSILVGERKLIRLARRARKRCGGGMRQSGVVASMGMYALLNNIDRLADDHRRAQRFARELERNSFTIARGGQVDTNMVFFSLPEHSAVAKDELCSRLEVDHGVKLSAGYMKGGSMFRACTHMDVDDEGIDRAAESLVRICLHN